MAAASGGSRWGVGLATALVWALAAGSALYWGLHARQPVAPNLPPAIGAPGPGVDAQAVARALGVPQSGAHDADASQPAIASRVRLSGVITHGAGGAALLAVDGKPPKPYRVGAQVDGDWVVHAVSPHAVELADGAQRASIEMPPLSARSRASDAVALGMAAGAPQPIGAPVAAPPSRPSGMPQPMGARIAAPLHMPQNK